MHTRTQENGMDRVLYEREMMLAQQIIRTFLSATLTENENEWANESIE